MTKIYGHRGCRGTQNPPENSLAAFAAAIAQGADGIELDVFATSDNHLVVFHDTSVEKLTNGHGKVSSLDLAALKEFKLKKNNSADASDQAIPTLDETLDLIKEKARPDFVVNIEMKGTGIAGQLADNIRKRLMKNWKRDNFIVSASDLNALRDFNRSLPAIPVGAILSGQAPTWNFSENMLTKKLPELADFHPSYICLTLPSMTPRAIAMIEKFGAKPVAWTVEEVLPANLSAEARAQIAAFLATGHIMITDYPGEVRGLIGTAAAKAS